MTLAGKTVVVLGAGRSGRAAAALALREGATVHAHDAADSISGMPVGVTLHPSADEESGCTTRCDLLVVSPGTTQTDFKEHLLEKLQPDPWPQQAAVTPQYVARRIVQAMRRGNHEIVPHPRGRLLVWLNRLSPRLVDALMERFA